MSCDHPRGAACWLCSDQVAWWRDARIAAGLGEDPPNYPRYVLTVEEIPEAVEAAPLAVKRTMTPEEEAHWRRTLAPPAPMTPQEPRAPRKPRPRPAVQLHNPASRSAPDDADIDDYWEKHPAMTRRQAAIALRRSRRATAHA